jgi:hypothetical protein
MKGLERVGLAHPLQADLEGDEVLLAEPCRSHARGNGLEDPADLLDFEHRRAVQEIADEAMPASSTSRREDCDAGSVADARACRAADERAGANDLSKRVPREPESCARYCSRGGLAATANSPETISSLILAIARSAATPWGLGCRDVHHVANGYSKR